MQIDERVLLEQQLILPLVLLQTLVLIEDGFFGSFGLGLLRLPLERLFLLLLEFLGQLDSLHIVVDPVLHELGRRPQLVRGHYFVDVRVEGALGHLFLLYFFFQDLYLLQPFDIPNVVSGLYVCEILLVRVEGVGLGFGPVVQVDFLFHFLLLLSLFPLQVVLLVHLRVLVESFEPLQLRLLLLVQVLAFFVDLRLRLLAYFLPQQELLLLFPDLSLGLVLRQSILAGRHVLRDLQGTLRQEGFEGHVLFVVSHKLLLGNRPLFVGLFLLLLAEGPVQLLHRNLDLRRLLLLFRLGSPFFDRNRLWLSHGSLFLFHTRRTHWFALSQNDVVKILFSQLEFEVQRVLLLFNIFQGTFAPGMLLGLRLGSGPGFVFGGSLGVVLQLNRLLYQGILQRTVDQFMLRVPRFG